MALRRRKIRWFRLIAVFATFAGGIAGACYGLGFWPAPSPIAPPPADVTANSSPLQGEQRRVDLFAQNEDLRSVAAEIGRQINREVLVGARIRQRVTLELEDVPWPEALAALAEASRCELEELSPDRYLLSRRPNVTVFAETDLRTALETLASQRECQIEIPPEIQGRLKADLLDLSWTEAMQSILAQAGPYQVVSQDPKTLIIVRSDSGR